MRLDAFLATLLPDIGLRARRRLCERGHVLIQGRRAGPALKLRAGMRVTLTDDATPPPALPRIILQARGLAAVAKPAGLASASVTAGEPSLEDLLPALFPSSEPRMLNRLDTGTSGLVLVATDTEGLRLWRKGPIRKEYLAIAEGGMPLGVPLTVDAALDTDNRKTTRAIPDLMAPPERRTGVLPLGSCTLGGVICTLVLCTITMGARHQIRAHLGHIGHPLLGDIRYGASHPGPFLLHHARCTSPEFTATLLPDWLDAIPMSLRRSIQSRFGIPSA